MKNQAVFLWYFCRMLQVKDLAFKYSKTTVLKAIDFKVEAGDNLAIIGESGSGKSTLLKLIYGEYDLKKAKFFGKTMKF